MYVYNLAVKTTHQRQGIGRDLMIAVFEAAAQTRSAEVFVQADEEDDHAVAFYQATGGNMEAVRHFLPIPFHDR